MQLTQFSDYALRTLVYLGMRDGALATIEEIAGAYGISESHLTKVVHKLGRLGIIDTVRGRGGGMRLSRRAADINIGATVRQTEGNLNIVECFDVEHNTCPIAPLCSLSGVLAEALEAFMVVLDRYTLADMIKNHRDLASLLSISIEDGVLRRPAIRS